MNNSCGNWRSETSWSVEIRTGNPGISRFTRSICSNSLQHTHTHECQSNGEVLINGQFLPRDLRKQVYQLSDKTAETYTAERHTGRVGALKTIIIALTFEKTTGQTDTRHQTAALRFALGPTDASA